MNLILILIILITTSSILHSLYDLGRSIVGQGSVNHFLQLLSLWKLQYPSQELILFCLSPNHFMFFLTNDKSNLIVDGGKCNWLAVTLFFQGNSSKITFSFLCFFWFNSFNDFDWGCSYSFLQGWTGGIKLSRHNIYGRYLKWKWKLT